MLFRKHTFNFSSDFWIPIFYSNFNSNDFCYQNLFWPFNVWINCSNDHKNFANSRPSASNFKSFSRSLKPFWTDQNCFGHIEGQGINLQLFFKFSAFSLEFQKFSRSLEQLFLTVGQNNFGNKIQTIFAVCLLKTFMP